ncbi:MAG TPA: alpha/beta hydrolase, partial [Vicinamibacterales bacterium]|nr:alpha/beta hydrolase [Vicinamibacterales bacterium]
LRRLDMSEHPAGRHAHVRLATGPRLHYVESGRHDGAPIVFLHGWPDSWYSFSRVLPLLPERLRALAVDQRGFGESDRPASSYAIADLAADAVAFLDALGLERATFVGHSFGSFVARQAAIANPARVDALALIGTGFAAANAVTRDLQHALRGLPDPIPIEFARDFQASTAYRSIPEDFFGQIVTESLKLPSRLWRVLIDRLLEYDDTEELAGIVCPTFLMWGERDALFSRNDQDRFLAALPRARLTVYEQTGHCPNWERPEAVAADIAAFAESAN